MTPDIEQRADHCGAIQQTAGCLKGLLSKQAHPSGMPPRHSPKSTRPLTENGKYRVFARSDFLKIPDGSRQSETVSNDLTLSGTINFQTV
jgi:hypothetical protein